MLVDFNITSEKSRLWIYAVDQKLKKIQKRHILDSISGFLNEWVAHKIPLNAGVTILEDYFIVIALDESKSVATGCSIDKLQKKIQEIEKELFVSLMDRMNIFCRIQDHIVCIPLSELV